MTSGQRVVRVNDTPRTVPRRSALTMHHVDDPPRHQRLIPGSHIMAAGLVIGFIATSSAAQSDETADPVPEPDPALVEYLESEKPSERPFNFTAYWENDGAFAKPNDDTDRHYTNGLAFSFAHRPQWARDLAEFIPFSENFEGGNIDGGYTFGQLMYTPDDIQDPRPIPDDHPYNGYLYVGAFLQREKDGTLDHFQLEIGIIGEASLAGSAQDFVHSIRSFDEPRGWRNQHSDEMMVQGYIRKKWRIDGVNFGMASEPGDFDIIPQVGVAMGTFTRHLEGALTVRLGDNLPQDYGPGRLQDIEFIPTERPSDWNWYLFGRLGGRIVEHSQVLEAKAFAVEEETFVGEAGGGFALSYLKDDFSFDFQYSQMFYTHTFEGQEDSNGYGSFTFSFSWHY